MKYNNLITIGHKCFQNIFIFLFGVKVESRVNSTSFVHYKEQLIGIQEKAYC